MNTYFPLNGKMQLVPVSEAVEPVKRVVKDKMHYPLEGVIPPINGKGSPIYFKTTDPPSHKALMELGTLLSKAHQEIENYRKENERLSGHLEFTNKKAGEVTDKVFDSNYEIAQRCKYLELMFKDLLRLTISLYPISLQVQGDDDQPVLNLQNVAEFWLHKARIKLDEKETIEPRRYYTHNKGSF